MYAYICVHVAESCRVVVETAWEDSLSETLETEVQETRKMVSALQVIISMLWFELGSGNHQYINRKGIIVLFLYILYFLTQ